MVTTSDLETSGVASGTGAYRPQIDTDLMYAKVNFWYIISSSAQRAIVSCCHTSASSMRRPSTTETTYSNIFFYKTTGPTGLKFQPDSRFSES